MDVLQIKRYILIDFFQLIFSHTQRVSVTLPITCIRRPCPRRRRRREVFWFFDFFSQTPARICFKFCVDVPWVDPY